jgi:hypothetical protein
MAASPWSQPTNPKNKTPDDAKTVESAPIVRAYAGDTGMPPGKEAQMRQRWLLAPDFEKRA